METKRDRLNFIDILKGMAIFLVVVGHFDPKNVYFPIWDSLIKLVYSFHMPLFMIISGFLYARTVKVDSIDDYFSLVRKKWKRLGIPYIFISLFVLVVKLIGGKIGRLEVPVSADFWRYILLNPMGGYATYLWFIYTLLVIFMVFPILNTLIKNRFLLLLILFSITFFKIPNYFCLNLVGAYLIYFYLGTLLYKNKFTIMSKNSVNLYCSIFLALFLTLFLVSEETIISFFRPAQVLIAVSGSITFWFLSMIIATHANLSRFFRILGIYSSAIYLFQGIAMGPVRMLVFDFDRVNYITFITSAILVSMAGLFLPILVTKYLINKFRYLSLLFLGVEPVKTHG